MSENRMNSRRTVLKNAAGLVGLALVGSAFAEEKKKPEEKKPEVKKAGDIPLLDEKLPAAAGLKYTHDASKLAPSVRTEKSGVSGKDQTCVNCMFYKKSGMVGKDEVGACQLFPQGAVKGKGWCMSWTKKA